jgi:RNAse (barnase) inhibitor barstar
MPTLDEILDDPAANGVYRLTNDPAVAQEGAASAASGVARPLYAPALPERPDILRLDARHYPDKDGLLAAIGEALHFPDYYGVNWDALEECLFDLSWWAGPVILLIEHSDALEGETLATLIDIWTEASAAWAEAGRGCVLLLAGADAGALTPTVEA